MMTATPTSTRESSERLLGSARNVSIWIGWHILAAICVPLVVVHMQLQTPILELPVPRQLVLGGLSVTYLLAAVALSWRALRSGRIQLYEVVLTVVVSYGLLCLVFALAGLPYSRRLLVTVGLVSFVLASLSLDLMQRLYKVLLPALLVATGGIVALGFSGGPSAEGVRTSVLLPIKLTIHKGLVPSQVEEGGSLETFGAGFLAASGDGALFYLENGPRQKLVSRRLPVRVPLNLGELRADSQNSAGILEPIRVTDILVEESGDRVRIFAAHPYWKSQDHCLVLRVSVAEASAAAFLQGQADVAWQTLYDSQPCLRGYAAGLLSGGRLLRIGGDALLLSVGDHDRNGLNPGQPNAQEMMPQEPTADYGKTIRIDTTTGASAVYSMGHRNPQGLHRMPDGRIWLTEHGPKGGDELNLLAQGANYGWPLVTLGTDYRKFTWPLNKHQGRHTGYVEPVFAWVPSVGVSAVTSLQRDLFPLWKGDLLVTSMKQETLFRLRVSDNRVVFVEPLYEVGAPIRDVVEGPDGRIVLLLEDGSVGTLEPVAVAAEPQSAAAAPPSRGELLFNMCRDCHAIGTGSDHAVGPDLRGILDRPVASAPGFEYSPGLSAVSGSWTRERLSSFLANPGEYAPGTSMQMSGVQDSAARAALIEYLATKR